MHTVTLQGGKVRSILYTRVIGAMDFQRTSQRVCVPNTVLAWLWSSEYQTKGYSPLARSKPA